jgi:uncharacterized membrane protein YqhA
MDGNHRFHGPLKSLSSIVAASAIHQRKQFMSIPIGQEGRTPANDRELFWYVVIHAFVISSLLIALSDRSSESTGHAAATRLVPPNARNGMP